MKRFLTFISLAAAVCSCSGLAGVQEEAPGRARAIVFAVAGTQSVGVETRSYSESTLSTLQSEGFSCVGVAQKGAVIFSGKAAWNGTEGVFLPVPGPCYFPTGETSSFYASYPVSVELDDRQAPSVQFVHDGSTDLLCASAEGVESSAEAVDLTFSHVLSLVTFKAAGKDGRAMYRLRGISLEVPKSGEYRYGTKDWILSDGTAAQEFFAGDAVLDGTAPVGEPATILPCEPVVTVKWDTYSLDGSVKIASYEESKALGRVLSMGEECTVTLMLHNGDAEGIAFSVAVTPWGPAEHTLDFSQKNNL